MITKPMHAAQLDDLKQLRFPVWATPKLDGIRALMINGKLVSRSFKPIRNKYIRETLEAILPNGIDGEIMSGKNFQECTSAVMTEKGEPSFTYNAFDYVKDDLNKPYMGEHHLKSRMADLGLWFAENIHDDEERVQCIFPNKVSNFKELLEYESKCLEMGYEGIITRLADSPYKCGRSTPKEQYLVKFKQWDESDAIVLALEERMHNANEAEKDAFGRTERSSCKDNMVPTNSLGAFVCKDIHTGVEFNVSGFTAEQQVEFWNEKYIGKIFKYKYSPFGVKNAPRYPGFIAFRHEDDL